jgi:flavin-dependent dehydrogenase
VTITTDEDCYQTRALVLADGFGSPLARQLGFGSVSDYVTGAQAVVSTSGINDVEVHLGRDVAPGFFSWVVPTLEGRALIGLLARREAQPLLSGFIQRQRHQGKITGVISKPAAWGIPLRPLRRTYQDRVLVVGDAAGQVKPTTGGGIYYSLLAGEIAGQALDEAFADDDLSAARLSQYQHRWKRLLSRELEVGYSARRLFEFLTDQQIASLVEQAGANGFRTELASSSDIGFDWHSRTIAKVLRHPVLGGALRVINPLLARLARPSDMSYGSPAASGGMPGTGPDTPD